MKYIIEITKGDARFAIDCIDALLNRTKENDRPLLFGSREMIKELRDRLEAKIQGRER